MTQQSCFLFPIRQLTRMQWKLGMVLAVMLVLMVGKLAASQPLQGQVAPLPLVSGSQSEATQLELAKPVVREIREGQTHTFHLVIPAKHYFKILIDQYGVDVSVALITPNGQLAYEILSAGGRQTGSIVGTGGAKTLLWVAEPGGDWQLNIALATGSAKAHYQVGLIENRLATQADRDLVSAMKLNNDSTILNLHGNREAAIIAAKQSLSLYEKVWGETHLDVVRMLIKLGSLHLDIDLGEAV